MAILRGAIRSCTRASSLDIVKRAGALVRINTCMVFIFFSRIRPWSTALETTVPTHLPEYVVRGTSEPSQAACKHAQPALRPYSMLDFLTAEQGHRSK
jgi:hypothetical protein